MTARLPKDASDLDGIHQYYETRARQLLHEGYAWTGHVHWVPGLEGQVAQTMIVSKAESRPFESFYLTPAARGKGLIRKVACIDWDAKGAMTGVPCSLFTLADCNLEPVLQHLGVPYRKVGLMTETLEYQLISEFYGDRRAHRSQVFLMNHIDEGLAVMRLVGASQEAMRAFCLHPLLQNDAGLKDNFSRVAQAALGAPDGAKVLALAMEYRSVANEYLANCKMREGGIRLSPLKEVNDMLIGDKVQNRKDFELYHAATHANSRRLAEYFSEWCEALGVADRYVALVEQLRVPT